MDAGRARLTIAGARFELDGLTVPLPGPFDRFLDSASGDLLCRVHAAGPDLSLGDGDVRADAPWSLEADAHDCRVTRRDCEGIPLWQVAAPLTFERAEVRWHPRRFTQVYGHYSQSWAGALGVTLLAFRLRRHGGLVLHGSAAVIDGRGIACVGISGTGKSTLARLLDAAGAVVLSDERPVVRRSRAPSGFHVHGSPWPSSAGYACPAAAPLSVLYFIEHGSENRITPLAAGEAFQRLVDVATIPWQEARLFDDCLRTVEDLLKRVPCARLVFRPDAGAVEDIRRHLAASWTERQETS